MNYSIQIHLKKINNLTPPIQGFKENQEKSNEEYSDEKIKDSDYIENHLNETIIEENSMKNTKTCYMMPL